jgi:manganese/zinc/iron transport system substrate-binding protein
MNPSRRLVLTSLAGVAAFAGLGPAAAAGATPLSVVATTGMIADVARAVAGDLAAVRGLMGPGVDPHLYRATRTDIAALARADLVLHHGLGLEAQMEPLFADLARRGAVVAVAEALPRAALRPHDTHAGRFDPHVWMDPRLWSQVAQTIADAIAGLVPGAAGTIAAAAAAYRAELDRLHAYAAGVLGTVPAGARVLVTAHDAFGYFGAAYGFEVMGIQGISTDSEAGLARIRDLVDLLVARRIPAVFVESSVSDRNLRALVEGAAAAGHGVRIGGELFSDAMGPEGSYEGTYIGMIDHNVTTIASALGGTAPPRGMDGRLTAGI